MALLVEMAGQGRFQLKATVIGSNGDFHDIDLMPHSFMDLH